MAYNVFEQDNGGVVLVYGLVDGKRVVVGEAIVQPPDKDNVVSAVVRLKNNDRDEVIARLTELGMPFQDPKTPIRKRSGNNSDLFEDLNLL